VTLYHWALRVSCTRERGGAPGARDGPGPLSRFGRRGGDHGWAGPREKGNAGLRRKDKEGGRPAGPKAERGRKVKEFLFSFSKAIFEIHFQKILNSFSVSVKTDHHKKKYAVA
jgi:hypothetical protein